MFERQTFGEDYWKNRRRPSRPLAVRRAGAVSWCARVSIAVMLLYNICYMKKRDGRAVETIFPPWRPLNLYAAGK